jgi:hypothetical protein
MPSAAKSRRYPRIGLPRGLYVAWQGLGDRLVSRVETLGMGGLFIQVADPPPVGESVRLYFQVPGGEVRARGVVRSSEPKKGMGIEFISMGHEGRARLHRLLGRLLVEYPSVNRDKDKLSSGK